MNKTGYSIAMIGAGNVAWHLAQALEKAGHQITFVYSRSLAPAQELSNQLKNAEATTSLNFRQKAVDLFLISVPDKALPEVLKQAVFLEGSLVAHTSGTLPLSVFQKLPQLNGAVFYPLQTFSKNTQVDFSAIPICLEAADENRMDLLEKVARSISSNVKQISSEERKILHVAAVFACNFTNHLFGISSEITKQHNLDFSLLHPLISETIRKALQNPPFSVQTGPAIRHDEATIQAHLEILRNEPAWQEIYKLLSKNIQEQAEK